MVTATAYVSNQDVVYSMQYASEGDTVTTNQSNFGTPDTDGAYILAGHVQEVSPVPDIQHMDITVLGSENITDALQTVKNYTFSIKFNPIDTALWQYLWNDIGSSSGNDPNESLTFMMGWKQGTTPTTNFQLFKGCRPTNGTLTLDRGVWECDMTFLAQSIDAPTTSANAGITNPTFDTDLAPSTSAIKHGDATTNVFVYNSTEYANRRFSTSVTRNMTVVVSNGSTKIVYSRPGAKVATWSADIPTSGNVFWNDWDAKTARTVAMKIGSSTMTYTNSVLTSWSQNRSAISDDAWQESIGGRAETINELS